MTGPDVLGTPGAPEIPAAPPGVHARGVRRSFGPVHAVQGVDLDAPPGEVTALVGPNGAGKTTLLLVLATLLRPDAGEVRVAGYDPISQPAEVRARMGWSPDVFGLYDNLTAREYLEAMAAAYRIPARARADRAGYLLRVARLPDKAEAPVHSLSRGQKQRLGLARALVHDPSVLLLDEPASGLDPRSREEVGDRVVFVDAGRTVGQHRISELPAGRAVRTYRLRALDPGGLRVALERERLRFTDAGAANGLDVQIAGGDA